MTVIALSTHQKPVQDPMVMGSYVSHPAKLAAPNPEKVKKMLRDKRLAKLLLQGM